MSKIVCRQLVDADAGQTVWRAAFLEEARLCATTEIPPLVETLGDLRREIATTCSYVAFCGERLVGATRLTVDGDLG